MIRSLLGDAFEHHVWATIGIIDTGIRLAQVVHHGTDDRLQQIPPQQA